MASAANEAVRIRYVANDVANPDMETGEWVMASDPLTHDNEITAQ